MRVRGRSRGLVGVLALFLGVAFAHGVAGQSAPHPGTGGGPPGGPERISPEEVGGMVDAYLVSNLQEALGLSDEKFVEVLPLVKRLRKDRRESFMERQRLLHGLRKQLKSGAATEPQIVDLLNQIKKVEAEFPVRSAREMEAVDAALTPLQQAKYRVLEAQVERRMHELLAEARRHRVGKGQRRERPEGETP